MNTYVRITLHKYTIDVKKSKISKTFVIEEAILRV